MQNSIYDVCDPFERFSAAVSWQLSKTFITFFDLARHCKFLTWNWIISWHACLWGNPHYHGFTCHGGFNTGTQLLSELSPGCSLHSAALRGITALLLGQPRGGVYWQYRLKSFMGASYLIPLAVLRQRSVMRRIPNSTTCTCSEKVKHPNHRFSAVM